MTDVHAVWGLMGGTLTIRSMSRADTVSTAALRRGTPRLVGIGRARCWVLRDRALFSTRLSAGRLTPNGPEVSGVRGGAEPEPRPHLENCTVDASIFVAKLLRAHGGCLGTRSRRRT